MWLVWIKILRLQNLNFEMFRTFVWKQRHGTFRVRLFWTIENFPLIFMPRVVFVTEHLQNRSAWNQVLESHHLISSFISQVSISRSRYWPRWNCRLNILDCRILNYCFKKWECYNVRWHWQLRTSTTNCTSPTSASCVQPSFKRLYALLQVLHRCKTYETYRQPTMHHFAKTQTNHKCCIKSLLLSNK